MTPWKYDPYDDWGLVPAPGQTHGSLQHAIRRAYDRLCCGDIAAKPWLEQAIPVLPRDSALRAEVQNRLLAHLW